MTKKKRILVVGGGPAGALCAKALAEQCTIAQNHDTGSSTTTAASATNTTTTTNNGDCLFEQEVILCEAYPHPSSLQNSKNKSKAYCIVLSARGQRALAQCGIDAMDVPGAVECTTLARHAPTKSTSSTARTFRTMTHDERPSVVVSRQNLAAFLIDEAAKAGVSVKLQHKLVHVDLDAKTAEFQVTNANDENKSSTSGTVQYQYDLLVGCDGSHSIVRTLLALKLSDNDDEEEVFRVRTIDDDMEYQVAVLDADSFQNVASNKQQAEDIPFETVHSWNDRSASSLCLAFPLRRDEAEQGARKGLLFTIIYPGGKLDDFKMTDAYDEALSSLLFDITETARSEIIRQLKADGGERPATGGTCVFASSLGSVKYGVVLVGDSGHGMFPSLGQGCNCALESAAVFGKTLEDIVAGTNMADDWPKALVKEYNSRRYDDATSAVALTYRGMGGTKKRHANNAPFLFMAQIGTIMFLHKLTFGLVPKPAMLRLMLGEDESYSSIANDHLIHERQKALLFGLALFLPIASYVYRKFVA